MATTIITKDITPMRAPTKTHALESRCSNLLIYLWWVNLTT